MAKKGQTLGTKCPACGASIDFDPKANKWKCKYCYSEFTLEEMEKVTSGSASKENNKDEKVTKEDVDYYTYNCQSCGAEIIADNETAATFCVYCGNTTILRNKLEGDFKPHYVIPFKTEKKEAEDAFKSLSKGRMFVPKDFTDQKNIEKIRGIYIPFWLYDMNIAGYMDGTGTKVRTWVAGNMQYTETKTYHVTRAANMDFIKIPIDGSTRFDNDIMDTIQPYDYKDLVKYNHAYLSGFYAERYDQGSEELVKIPQDRAIKTVETDMLNSIKGYSTKNIKQKNFIPKITNCEYALLPVWMVNVKYKGKQYLFAMNGQTKEFIGDIPVDKKKVVIVSIICLIVIAAVVLGISYLIFNVTK